MPRFINANLLRADFTGNFQESYTVGQIRAMIDDVPTADVEEVRHGEWIKVRTNVYRCSHCSRIELLEGCNVTNENEKELLQIFYPYCHCGAKMDGKKGEKHD